MTRIFSQPMGSGKTTRLLQIMLAPGGEDIVYVSPTRKQAMWAYEVAKKMIVDAGINRNYPNLAQRFIPVHDARKTPEGSRFVVDELDGVLQGILGGTVVAAAGTDGNEKKEHIDLMRSWK